MGPPRFRCALWSLLLASEWSDQFQEIKSRNEIEKKNKNQNGVKITLEEELELGISKIQEVDSKREDDQFSSGLSIIVWIIYVYYSVNITVSDYRYDLRSLFM